MARYYYLFPAEDGPFPNPFPIGDPLFELSQEGVLCLREPVAETVPSSREDSRAPSPSAVDAERQWRHKQFMVPFEACSIAFTALANRTLIADPPTEAHLDFTLAEAARRTIALAFYISYEAWGRRMPYGQKRSIEVMLPEWIERAKDIWRARVLSSTCRKLMAVPREEHWWIPGPVGYLQEELWRVHPEALIPPPEITEVLFVPANHSAIEADEIWKWTAEALRFHPRSEGGGCSRGKGSKAPKSEVTGRRDAELVLDQRAAWLRDRLLERGWSTSDAHEHGGPDRKTLQKILRGEKVRNDVLERLADALSKKNSKVSVLAIPQD